MKKLIIILLILFVAGNVLAGKPPSPFVVTVDSVLYNVDSTGIKDFYIFFNKGVDTLSGNGSNIFTTADFLVENLGVNRDASNDAAVIFFYKPTSGSATLLWHNTEKRFVFSDSVKIEGTLSIKDAFRFPVVDGSANQSFVTDGAGNVTWATPAGGGDVSKVGTPVNNQVGVWTGDGTIEGDADLTFDGSNLTTGGLFTNTLISAGADLEIAGAGQNDNIDINGGVAGNIRFYDEGTLRWTINATTLTANNSSRILDLTDPITDQEAATKKYVDDNSGGDVSKVGTPVNNQVGVWTGDGTIEGDAGLTFDGTDLTTTGIINSSAINTGNGDYEIQDADDDGTTKGLASFDNTDFDAVSGNVTINDDGHNHTTSSLTLNLDEVGNPATDKTFSMANKSLKFAFTNPGAYDGAVEIELIGAFTGDGLHIHQHTGNPGGGHLVHLEAADVDIIPLCVIGAADTNAVFEGGLVQMDTLDVSGVTRLDGNVTLGGTIDGVDLAALDTDVAADSGSWNATADYFGTKVITDDNILVADGSDFKSVAMSGDVTINNGVTTIGVDKIDSTNIASDGIDPTTDINWQYEYFYLDQVHGWNRPLEDSIFLSFPVHDGASSWLLTDSAGDIGTDADTFFVSGYIPHAGIVESVIYMYRTTTATATDSKIDSINFYTSDISDGTFLADSSHFVDATDRNGTAWTIVSLDITDYTATEGERFAMKFFNKFGTDNKAIHIGWIRCVYKR